MSSTATRTSSVATCRSFSAGDRVCVVVENAYRHDRTGREAVQSACKIYELRDGVIVRFWGESDTWGLLTGSA